MIITPFEMYILLMLDNISMAATAASIILGVLSVFALLGVCINNVEENDKKYVLKIVKTICRAFVFCTLVSVFLPNTKQAATIILVPKILNNEKVQDIGQNGLDLANNLLKLSNEYIEKNLITKEKEK